MALHVADRGVGGEVVERSVGDHEALGGERRGGFALGAAHLGVELHHQQARVLGRAGRGGDAGFQVDGRHLFVAAAGEHRPPFDANGLDRRPVSACDPRRLPRRRTCRPGRAVGPATGSSNVSRASTRRTPSTNATRSTPSSTPSSGSQSSCSTVGSTDPSAGASASSWSRGVPYSGSQPSTKICAMARIVPAHPDSPRLQRRLFLEVFTKPSDGSVLPDAGADRRWDSSASRPPRRRFRSGSGPAARR